MTSSKLISVLFKIFISAIVVMAAVFILYFSNFNGKFTSQPEYWGTFGDFVGGTLNPILSFFALLALLITIILQNRELEATRDEIAQSRLAAQEQVLHFKNESKKADVYKTIQVLEIRLERLYKEPLYFISDGKLRKREFYFLLTFATDDALTQIIKPEERPPEDYETELVNTKSTLMDLHLTIVKLSMQLTMLTEYRNNNAILFFYEPTINHLASKLDKIGYLPPDDKKLLKINADIRSRNLNAQNQTLNADVQL